MLLEGHSWIQGQDDHMDVSLVQERNKVGHVHLLSPCCVPRDMLGTVTGVTLAALFFTRTGRGTVATGTSGTVSTLHSTDPPRFQQRTALPEMRWMV